MAIEHKDIPDAQLHEPKGAVSASSGEVYVSDGAGSGSWDFAQILGQAAATEGHQPYADGAGGVSWSRDTIERLVDGKSVAATQNPTGTGEGNSVQVEFGPALNGVSDPVQLLADGTLRFNDAGLYRVKITLSYGRTGGTGVSELRFRALLDGTQAGQSIGVKVDDADTSIVFTDEAWLEISAGTDITYEVMRDASGNNSGGLLQSTIDAATAPNWNAATCAAIRVERFVKS